MLYFDVFLACDATQIKCVLSCSVLFPVSAAAFIALDHCVDEWRCRLLYADLPVVYLSTPGGTPWKKCILDPGKLCRDRRGPTCEAALACVWWRKELIIAGSFGVRWTRLQSLSSEWPPCSSGRFIRQREVHSGMIVSEFPLESVACPGWTEIPCLG